MSFVLTTPRQIYKRLSNNNKVQFWAITSSCFVAVFTFFIGLTYQYLVIDDSKEENRRIIHTQYVDNILPILLQRREIENYSYLFSNRIHKMQNTIERIQKAYNQNNILVGEVSNDFNLLTQINEFADSIYKYGIKYHNLIDIPKYYLYDNLRDSISLKQDDLELQIKAYEILDFIMKNSSLSKDELEKQLENIIAVPATLDVKLSKIVNDHYNAGVADNTVAKLKLADSMFDNIIYIDDIFKKESMPPFNKTPINQGRNNVIVVGIILCLIGGLSWVVIINITFRNKHQVSNPFSSLDSVNNSAVIDEIISLYNNNDIINDDEYVTDPLIIYRRLYNQWNEMRMELNKLKSKNDSYSPHE